MSDEGDFDWLVARQSGVLSRRQALRFLTPKAVDHRLASNRWVAAHRGIYVTNTGARTREQRRWIAVLAVGPTGKGAVLAGLSALELLGMQDHYRESLHVLIPARRQVVNAPTDVVVHRTSGLGRGEVKPEQTPPCTMPVRSTIDAAQWAETDDEARAIVVSGYQQGLVVGTEIAEALDGALKVRRRALILQTAADAAVGCEAIPEREVVRLCRQFQLPPPSRQELRADAAGRKRYRDVFFAGWPVQVEVDGEPTTEARAWPADLRRQNELIIAGVRLLRFTSWMVRNQPGVVATQLRAALEAAGWSPKH